MNWLTGLSLCFWSRVVCRCSPFCSLSSSSLVNSVRNVRRSSKWVSETEFIVDFFCLSDVEQLSAEKRVLCGVRNDESIDLGEFNENGRMSFHKEMFHKANFFEETAETWLNECVLCRLCDFIFPCSSNNSGRKFFNCRTFSWWIIDKSSDRTVGTWRWKTLMCFLDVFALFQTNDNSTWLNSLTMVDSQTTLLLNNRTNHQWLKSEMIVERKQTSPLKKMSPTWLVLTDVDKSFDWWVDSSMNCPQYDWSACFLELWFFHLAIVSSEIRNKTWNARSVGQSNWEVVHRD